MKFKMRVRSALLFCLALGLIRSIGSPASIKVEKIVMFGDSIVHSASAPRGSKLPDFVKSRLDSLSSGKAIWEVVNSGVGRETAYDAVKRIEGVLRDEKPDYISIAYGLVDCGAKNPIRFERSLLALLSMAAKAAPEAAVFLATTVPFNESAHVWGKAGYFVRRGGINRYADREINSITRRQAVKSGLPLIDLNRFLRPLETWQDAVRVDGIHPDLNGNKLAGDYIAEVIFSYFAARKLQDPVFVGAESDARRMIREGLFRFLSSPGKSSGVVSALMDSAWERCPYLPQAFNPWKAFD